MNLPYYNRLLMFSAFIFSVSAWPCKVAHADSTYPPLNIYDTSYPNACSPSKQLELWKAISGKVKDEASARRALHALLCGPRTGPERVFLASLFPLKLREKIQGTGQEPRSEIVLRSDELIDRTAAAGEAWGASVTVTHDRIDLSYHPDEVCVSGFTLSYQGAKWVIDEIGSACD